MSRIIQSGLTGIFDDLRRLKTDDPELQTIQESASKYQEKEEGEKTPSLEFIVRKIRRLENHNCELPAEKQTVASITVKFREVEAAKDAMVKANLRLVIATAKYFTPTPGIPLNDLIQDGNIGLLRAAYRFNPESGNKFSTYAVWWIRQAIGRAIMFGGRAIRWPTHVYEVNRHISRFRKEYCVGPNEMTHVEVAKKLDLNVETAKNMELTDYVLSSLDAPCPNSYNDQSVLSLLQDKDKPTIDQQVSNKQLAQKLKGILDQLPPKNAEIMRLRYGIDKDHEHTLEEVGEMFNLSRERIRQIQNNSLAKMRHPQKKQQLLGFLDA